VSETNPSTRIKQRISALRQRYPVVDHVLAMNEHYGKVHGSVLAGAATYFGFLSFFPILALAFAVVGYVSVAFPDARDSLITAIEQLFPGIVSQSGEPGTISLSQIEDAKAAAGIIGFIGVLYSGLGWVSGLRVALQDAFSVPRNSQRSMLVGKGIDLMAMVVLGFILLVSVSVSGFVKGAADQILDWLTLDDNAIGEPLIWVVGVLVGVLASTALFYVMFKLLGGSSLPNRPLVEGALLAATGFEALKIIVVNVVDFVGGSAFAPLAIAITLVVWINYFSRLVIYGACWAVTSPKAVSVTDPDASEVVVVPASMADEEWAVAATRAEHRGRFDTGSAVIGAAAGFLAATLARRRRD
jgi:membrane protein